ncbi:MAG: hypothetical protein ABJ242_01240 [Marinomonas sp.]
MFASEAGLVVSQSGHADVALGMQHMRPKAEKYSNSRKEAGALVGHYIEDDALDALALTGMLNGEAGISLTTSTSLNDFEDWIVGDDLDFVLVDIYRPDSRSFEEEVKRIRAHSAAAIFFITGDEAKFYVDDAVEVGAEGVLEKEALTATGLLQLLRKAIEARPAEPCGGKFMASRAGSTPPEFGKSGAENENLFAKADQRPDWLVMPAQHAASRVDPARFEAAQIYLHDAIEALSRSSIEARAFEDILGVLADAQVLLKLVSQGSASEREGRTCSVPRAIRELQRIALSMAKQRGIELVFQATESVFDEMAMSEASLCIRSLLKAVIIGSPKGATVKFNALSNADGIRLSIASSADFPFDADDVTGKKLIKGNANLPSTILMTAVSMLLGVKASNITIFKRGLFNTILIDIQDG